MRNPFWGILGLFLLAPLVLLAGCAAEGGYQRPEAGYYRAPEYGYYRGYEPEYPATSGGVWGGPPPEAGP
jgi:hypothetical protein